MSSFLTAHTFCASRDGLRNSGFLCTVPSNIKVFLRGSEVCRKSRSYQELLESGKKIEGNHAFSETTEFKSGKHMPYNVLYFTVFLIGQCTRHVSAIGIVRAITLAVLGQLHLNVFFL